ncbi:recombinase family protein [Candidatus Giovannonibacteria bacterium]|nr:recombinase family protein [Candidatus Giovannonibacteria bacterium]
MKLAETWGLRSRKNKVLALSNIQSILKKPFYYGLICLNGEFFEGSHTPIISKKLFDKVQEVMRNKEKPRKVKSHKFPFL